MEDSIVCHLSYENGTLLFEKILGLLKDLFPCSKPIYLQMNDHLDSKIKGRVQYGVREGWFAKGLYAKEIGDVVLISTAHAEKPSSVNRVSISTIVNSSDNGITDERFYDSITRTMTTSKSKRVKLKYRCVVLYIELLLHELGHVYYCQDMKWNMSEYIRSVNRTMSIVFDNMCAANDAKKDPELRRRLYRIRILESLADGFARSYLLYVIQSIPDIMNYFEFISRDEYERRVKEEKESDDRDDQ